MLALVNLAIYGGILAAVLALIGALILRAVTLQAGVFEPVV
jgi:formate-dependent nitrite reductase membrane component NrfD